MPAVEPPPQVTQNEPPPFQPPQQSVAPAVPGVDTKQLEDLRERFLLLATRANSLRGSLNAMRKQMESLNLNAEFTTREQRMEAYLDQAEEALKAHNTASGRNRLDAAERVIEELEKKFGR
jgi:predicted RNase H-like nuclease (RuvC/YqgF family)